MTPERWQRINDVLEAIDSASPADRATTLDRLCAGDPDLRREVEPFLATAGAGTFLHGVIGQQAASLSETTATAARQERFRHYRILQRIGQGGMGAVFEAVRVDDFHKKVALKIIRQELDSDFARTRFLQESQLLATLEHPYIARLLDGGETDDGSPYPVGETACQMPFISQLFRPWLRKHAELREPRYTLRAMIEHTCCSASLLKQYRAWRALKPRLPRRFAGNRTSSGCLSCVCSPKVICCWKTFRA